MKMVQSQTNSCALYKHDEKDELMLMVSITIDDYTVMELNNNVDWLMSEIERRFNINRDMLLKIQLGKFCK